MRVVKRALLAGVLLLTGYLTGPRLAHAFEDCSGWQTPGPVFIGIAVYGAATRSCTFTCSQSADWDGTHWTVNQPNCN